MHTYYIGGKFAQNTSTLLGMSGGGGGWGGGGMVAST